MPPSALLQVSKKNSRTKPTRTRGFDMIRALYDWVFRLAEHKRASWALSGVSFVESSFFPIPPDVLLIPMVLAKRHKWIFYATICTVASILGAFLGYYIGAALYETIGKPILAFYGREDSFSKIAEYGTIPGEAGAFFLRPSRHFPIRFSPSSPGQQALIWQHSSS